MPKSKAAAKDYGDLKCCDSQFEEVPIDRRWDGLNIKKFTAADRYKADT